MKLRLLEPLSSPSDRFILQDKPKARLISPQNDRTHSQAREHTNIDTGSTPRGYDALRAARGCARDYRPRRPRRLGTKACPARRRRLTRIGWRPRLGPQQRRVHAARCVMGVCEAQPDASTQARASCSSCHSGSSVHQGRAAFQLTPVASGIAARLRPTRAAHPTGPARFLNRPGDIPSFRE